MSTVSYPPGYTAVIGLEIHAQLATESKIFCPDPVAFAGRPNTRTSPITLGHPGTLPQLNARCVELAVKMGLATGCSIAPTCHFARKNYFYPDLPKGYQISQDNTPICREGQLPIRYSFTPGGELITETIRIQRIHIEEDAGKSLHDQDPFDTLIDLNRASVGLIEIVSMPDLRSPEAAMAYVAEIRKLVRYLGVSDGNMEEGHLRCDANVSVMKVGATQFGTRTETKNINSISNVGRAIRYEIERQIALLENGGKVAQETRTWEPVAGKTLVMRDKETADDYRYFPEPDLQPLVMTQAEVERLRAELPELPEALYQRFTTQHSLPDFDAGLLTESRAFADYFLAVFAHTQDARPTSNWLLGPVRSYLNETATEITAFPIPPRQLARLIQLVLDGKVSLTVAREELFRRLLAAPGNDPETLAREANLLLETDTAALDQEINTLLDANPDKVRNYLGGKTGLLGFFVGQVMKSTGGKADPKVINTLIAEALERRRT